jgi:hypothetical protein
LLDVGRLGIDDSATFGAEGKEVARAAPEPPAVFPLEPAGEDRVAVAWSGAAGEEFPTAGAVLAGRTADTSEGTGSSGVPFNSCRSSSISTFTTRALGRWVCPGRLSIRPSSEKRKKIGMQGP